MTTFQEPVCVAAPQHTEVLKPNRRSSAQTASTVSMSNESGVSLPPKVSSKKSKGSRRKKMSRGREVLMGMIAQEMVSSWNDDEDLLEVPSAKSMADIFYAQINGEAIDVSQHTSSINSDVKDEMSDLEDDEDCLPDSCSFAGLDVTEDIHSHSTGDKSSKTGRRRKSSGSAASPVPRSVTSISHGSDASKTSSHESASSRKESTQSSGSSSEGGLSVEEIKEYVMASIPPSLRDQITTDAWNQIFGDASQTGRTKKIPLPNNSVGLELSEEDEMADDDDVDDLSVISDITEATSFFKSGTESAKNLLIDPPADDFDIFPDDKPDSFRTSRSCSESRRASETSLHDNRSRTSAKTKISASGSSKEASAKTKKIIFDCVQVRYYERILELNPAVTSGPPIGIGWRFKKGGQVSVDEWENQRGQYRKPNDLVIPRHVREGMLKEIGYTQKDIADAVRLVVRSKNQRRQTISNLGTAGVEEAVETASRRVKGLLSFGKTKGLIKQ